jgi:hypothetical protein
MIEVNGAEIKMQGKKSVIIAEMATLVHAMLNDPQFDRKLVTESIARAFLRIEDITALTMARGYVDGLES